MTASCDKSYIVRMKVSFQEVGASWKNLFYIRYEEIKEITEDGNFIVETEDDFNCKIEKKVKLKELNLLHKSNSKRSYEYLLKVETKEYFNVIDLKEKMYRMVIDNIDLEINKLDNLRDFVKDLEDEENIFI